MCRVADIVVENFAPGTVDRLDDSDTPDESVRTPGGSTPFLGSDIVSVPPSRTRCSWPAMTSAAAKLLAVIPGAAEAIERHTASAHVVVAGIERRHAAEVAALLANL
jgi:hypothetical protein